MNRVAAALHQIAADLDERGLHWALVGDFALSARAEPRFTRVVDVAVAVADDLEAERVVRELLGERYQLMASVEQDAVGRLATVRLGRVATPDVVVDVLFASSGVEPEIVAGADRIEIVPGLTVPVARIGHLIAVKLLARDDATRPQDHADLRALREVAGADDWADAERAIALITSRGFHRGRDLRAALAELRSR